MTDRSSAHSTSLRLSSGAVILMAVVMAGGLLTPAFGEPATAASAPRPVISQAVFAWSPAQVRQLIDEIAAARKIGLDPSDYGIDALKGELVQSTEFLGTPGSRQLDTLADTVALKLANDYRRGRAPLVRTADVRAALRADRLRLWFASLRASEFEGKQS